MKSQATGNKVWGKVEKLKSASSEGNNSPGEQVCDKENTPSQPDGGLCLDVGLKRPQILPVNDVMIVAGN